MRRDGAYEYCSQKAWEARRRIDIFGPVFMHRHQHNDDDETVHDRYLEDGIEKAVYRRRTQTEGEDFSYKRVIQSPHDISKAMRPGGTILKAAMGNKALAAHVEEVLRRRRPRGVEVNVVVREPVPGFPSTMIIDDRWVFFSLPTQRASMTGATAADERFDYDFVLGIEDVDGVLPRQLRTIITEFARIGTPIHGVS